TNETNTSDKVGDLRLGPKFRLFEEGQSPMPFSMAISGQAYVPTGSQELPAQLDRDTAMNGDEVGGDVMAIFDKNLFTLPGDVPVTLDRKSTRLNSSHDQISYAVFCLKKKKLIQQISQILFPISQTSCTSFFAKMTYSPWTPFWCSPIHSDASISRALCSLYLSSHAIT